MYSSMLFFFFGLVLLILQSDFVESINWQSGGWALGCDFKNNDLSNVKIASSQCGGRCAATPGCTHFTWTSYQGGTCWMKSGSVSQSNAFPVSDQSVVCGIVSSNPNPAAPKPAPPGPSNYPVYTNVLTTYHGATESGACRLPAESYAFTNPVALGNINSLQSIKFQGNLCGHVLQVNCGKGILNIIVSNSNLGGGLDLYASSWNKATNYLSPGQQYCSIQFTSQNSLTSSAPKCYFADGETTNQYYRSVGLLNTGGKIVKSATFNGVNGANNGQDFYYNFNVFGRSKDQVNFYFQDGSSYSVAIGNCLSGAKKQMWS